MFRFLIPALLVAAPAAAFDPHNLPRQGGYQVRELARFAVALERCPRARAAPGARRFWNDVRAQWKYVPERWSEDEPHVRALVRSEIARQREITPLAADNCEHLKRYYGSSADPRNNDIVMRDGSDTTAKCRLDGSCSAQGTFSFEFF